MAGPAGQGPRSPLLRKALPVLAILLGLSFSIDTDSLFPLLRGGETTATILSRSQYYQRLIVSNDALEAQVQYLGTREGGKWAVYRYQGLVEPGQQVGRVVEAPAVAPAPLSQAQRMRNWIAATEDYGAQVVHGLWQMALCYSGWRPLDQPPTGRNAGAADVSNTAGTGGNSSAGAGGNQQPPPSPSPP